MKTHHADARGWLPKSPTGIVGFDELTGGGLPTGRPTLICGGAGCGKTLFAMEFLVRGCRDFREPGVFVAFEESLDDLTKNVRPLGFDLPRLIQRKKLVVDHVRIERAEIEETGAYNLDGLFIRLGHAIDSIGAKRVVLDTIEALFAALPSPAIVRAELRRLFGWLKLKAVTAVVTAEKGDGTLTRHGLEEYVSDCVILLDHRVIDQVSTRRLRVVKYRGSTHGTNEYPFLIDAAGISVWPVTSLQLNQPASSHRITSGIPRLDFMLGGKGYYRGSTILVSGTAGTGKTSIAATLADATCRRRERCLYFAFEESAAQIVRNLRSIGLNLQPWIDQGRLQFHSIRPTFWGLEMHLAQIVKIVDEFKPAVVVLDPIGSLSATGNLLELKSALMRLIDFLKARGTTTLLNDLTGGGVKLERTDTAVSSLVDTWLVLRDLETNGERNRGLHVLKSRGMAHSNQIREFRLTNHGIELIDVYAGPAGVLTGSARLAQEVQETAERVRREQQLLRGREALLRKRQVTESQIAALRAELANETAEFERQKVDAQLLATTESGNKRKMAAFRHADAPSASHHRHKNNHGVFP